MFAVSLALVAQEFAAGRGARDGDGHLRRDDRRRPWRSDRSSAARSPSGLGWRWVFFLNVPIGIAAIAVTFAKLRESRDPNATRVDWLGLVDVQHGAAAAGAGAAARQRRRLGQPADPRPVRRRRGDARRVRGDRAAGRGADAAARAVPPPRVHRRSARGVRGLGLAVRAVPVPDAVPAELPRLLAAAGRASLPADHARAVLRRAARGRADGAGPARGS